MLSMIMAPRKLYKLTGRKADIKESLLIPGIYQVYTRYIPQKLDAGPGVAKWSEPRLQKYFDVFIGNPALNLIAPLDISPLDLASFARPQELLLFYFILFFV